MAVKVLELCAGLGGTRAGLEAAGWQTVQAVDADALAVQAHRLAFGDAMLGEVRELMADDLPDFDALSAGFPCQPFSSSGGRAGPNHKSGNVFEGIADLVAKRLPKYVLLENVYGLLHNKRGHTFARVLQTLTDFGYRVEWLTVDLRWFGFPQTRPRVLILATKPSVPLAGSAHLSLFQPLKQHLRLIQVGGSIAGSLAAVERERRPAVGKPEPRGEMPFGTAGWAEADHFVSFRSKQAESVALRQSLGSVVAPAFNYPDEIKSARYWAYDGPSSHHLRHEPVAHCIGTSLGGAPLFAVARQRLGTLTAARAFTELSNWHRTEGEYHVMRLRPHRATRLFGAHTESLEVALRELLIGDTRKYVLVGNMNPPVLAKAMAFAVEGRPLATLLPA